MAGITYAGAVAQLAAWLAADAAVAKGQTFEFSTEGGGSRKLSKVDAAEITNKLNYWNRMVKQLEADATRDPTKSSVQNRVCLGNFL